MQVRQRVQRIKSPTHKTSLQFDQTLHIYNQLDTIFHQNINDYQMDNGFVQTEHIHFQTNNQTNHLPI